MPSPYIKSLVNSTGKSEKELEKLWKKAKEITSEEFGKSESDFGREEFAYTTGVVKKMLGVDEAILDPVNFLDSKLSAREYIEEVTTSSQFNIGNVKPPKKKDEEEPETEPEKKDDEEDEEDEEKKDKKKEEPKEEETDWGKSLDSFIEADLEE